MKGNQFVIMNLIICSAILFLCVSCSYSPNKNNMSKQYYYELEAEKANYSDSIFMGFNFAMDSCQIMNHVKNSDAWRFYDTGAGRDRLFMQRQRMAELTGWTNRDFEDDYNCDFDDMYYEDYEVMSQYTTDYLAIDGFTYNTTYFTKFIVQNDDGTLDEETAAFGLDILHNKLRSITICFDGFSIAKSPSEVDYHPLFNAIKNTISLKYGEPYYCTETDIEWISGIIHINLSYDGVKYKYNYSAKFDSRENKKNYYPYYIVKYTNYVFEKELMQEYKDREKAEEIQRQKEEQEKQEKLKAEFITNSF